MKQALDKKICELRPSEDDRGLAKVLGRDDPR